MRAVERDLGAVRLHVLEAGEEDRPLVVLVHGFPDLAYGWRHQIDALASAGYRVAAPDMRGCGRSSAPDGEEPYAMAHLCSDVALLIEALGERDAVVVGHDMGGVVAWRMALHFPDRVRAVAGVNTPLLPLVPLELLRMKPGSFDHHVYFQEPGVAERELEADVRRTFVVLMRASDPRDGVAGASTEGVVARGGLIVGAPLDLERSVMLRAQDLDYYVTEYERTGFRGALGWFRNYDRNWRFDKRALGKQVSQPALMVTVGRDPVLSPKLAEPMSRWVTRLAHAHIEDCGHFTPQERPRELNAILIDWLGTLVSSPRP